MKYVFTNFFASHFSMKFFFFNIALIDQDALILLNIASLKFLTPEV